MPQELGGHLDPEQVHTDAQIYAALQEVSMQSIPAAQAHGELPKDEKQLSDLVEEIRKLKSVIVKQENRIRALEATVKAGLAPPAPAPAPTPPAPSPNNHDDGMAPDEV